jgi:CO/xanthine dehydrogenase FAD-binding subunit
MEFLRPATLADALAAKAEYPGALAIQGGTDVMVEMNFDRHRPPALIDLNRVAELREWGADDGRIRLGAGVSYTRVIDELGDRLPGLAMASRTVGSPQIRNRGTVGGNLGAASPAGDAHPALLAADAEIELASVDEGTRVLRAEDFYVGVKRHAARPDELITAILIRPAAGPQQFSKIGTRNAMVISVAAFSIALHPDRRLVGTGIGSVAPTPRRAVEAEDFLSGELESAGMWDSRGELPDSVAREFGERVKAAGAPIDDVRGTAAYRLHALAVMARRALAWAWDDYRRTGAADGADGARGGLT